MQSLIQIVNKLQDVFAVVGEQQITVDLPQIVVVGTQSSGKSSVLESIVGKSFLPRGTGIVTRAPLVIQMIKYTEETRKSMLMSNNIKDTENIKEWAEFLHKPNLYYVDFDLVRKEIEDKTNSLAGTNKGISFNSIVLKIHTNRYDLTFVDLPGITKVAVGDQPEDIDEQIQKLIISYVKQSNSIILAVVTANTDPSTSESLQIAKKMDPDGIRTIAVVTKLDLIDEGTLQDTNDLLCGRKIPVKLGIIGVVNRSQKDIVENKSMDAALSAETEFLKNNYPDIHKKHGNEALVHTLQTVLITHIKKVFPQLRVELEEMKRKLEKQRLPLCKPDEQISFLVGLLKDISRCYEDTMNGNQDDVPIDETFGGGSIAKLFQHQYLKRINAIDPLQDLSDENIANILSNTSGTYQCTFVNEKGLQKILRRQLNNLIQPSLDCAELVCDEMLNVLNSIDVKLLDTLRRYPKLYEDVRKVFEKLLEEDVNNIKEFIASYIESYQECINTANPDFILEILTSNDTIQEEILAAVNIKKHESNYKPELVLTPTGMPIFPLPDRMAQTDRLKTVRSHMLKQLLSGLNNQDVPMESSEQIKLHKYLSYCYFEYIRKIVRDFVPKRIVHKMVNSFLKNLDKRLNKEIFQAYLKENKIAEVFVEDESIINDRNNVEIKLDAVGKALKTMVDIRNC
ncbi:dynamin-1-like protein [Acyrthosiphon pisum]|uniref:Dynamin GTPase n=1 Tax=Acyrthosiphon pisum TaxID=7029 RepID=A0A8R1W4D1_ACYPI|nr:dynamin-1-like protein [Acyrthosiphon pisum]|eukprot:XP_001949574.1 PREDICTED: dynamin-1-like protein [Acyrthosiphon pisum]